jgi:hypothetical protein
MFGNWTRVARTVGTADPTYSVTWTDGTLSITEFQQVFIVTDRRNRPEVVGAVVLAEILHGLLEEEFAEQREAELEGNEEAYEADRSYYGGM